MNNIKFHLHLLPIFKISFLYENIFIYCDLFLYFILLGLIFIEFINPDHFNYKIHFKFTIAFISFLVLF